MIASQKVVWITIPLSMPLFLKSVTSRPAGPTANTVPTMISRITENTRMTLCMTGPR